MAKKYQTILLEVTKDRIDIFQDGKSQGLSSNEILKKLEAFDRNLPDSYRALVGSSSFSDPASRYTVPTHDEVMGGPVQTE